MEVMEQTPVNVPKMITSFSEDDWFKRPVIVNIQQIATAVQIQNAIPFAQLWLSDPLVNRKLKSVQLIRPMWKVRVHLTSSPTVYGAMGVCVALNGTNPYNFKSMQYCPNSGIISSCGVNEIVFNVPWHYPHDYYTLVDGGLTVNRNVTEAGTSGDVLPVLPNIVLESDGTLLSVAATFPGVALTTTVWCESLDTARIYTPQSGRDEYSKPEVSKTATALAKELDKVKNPVLTPFTTATSLALKVGSGVASAFGFSRPMEIETAHPCVLQKYGNTYSGVGTRVGRKICDDPKQELVLSDPSVGLSDGVDELSFDRLVDGWTYVTGAAITLPVTAGALLYFPVTPTVCRPTSQADWFHYSPMSLTAMCFRQWRGDMRYKVRIDSTVYHSGIIAVVYSPIIRNGNITTTNTNELLLIDVNGTKEVEFVVPYSNATPYLKTRQWSNGVTQASTVPDAQLFCNGDIRIQVYSPLAGAAPLRLSVWCKGEPGFDFNQLSDFPSQARFNNALAPDTITAIQLPAVYPISSSVSTVGTSSTGLYVPQSGLLAGAANVDSVDPGVVLGPHATDNVTHQTVIGQHFRSIRPFLKKNQPFIRWNTSATYSLIGIDLPSFPMAPARYTLAGVNTHYVESHMLGLFSSGFLGWRGAIRYHASPTADGEASVILTANVTNPATACNAFPALTNVVGQPEFSNLRNQYVNSNRGVQHFGHEEEVSFEIPYRYPQSFMMTKKGNNLNNFGPAPVDTKNLSFATLYYQILGGTRVGIDVSTGEDFNYFIRTPLHPITIWTNTTVTTLVTATVNPPVLNLANASAPSSTPLPTLVTQSYNEEQTSYQPIDYDGDILEQVDLISELDPQAEEFRPVFSDGSVHYFGKQQN